MAALVVADLTRGVSTAAPRSEVAAPDSTPSGTGEGDDVATAVARKLGLGTRKMASALLTRTPAREIRNAVHGGTAKRLLWPVEQGNFVRGFGYVRKVRRELPHLGVDIAARTGTPISAAADGLVAYADDGVKGFGNLLILVHGDGAVTSYAHCNRLLVRVGESVSRGALVAEVGSTGISKGPHLHFEFRTRGKPRNPMKRFDRPKHEPKAPSLALALVPHYAAL
jgi:murein DD-endopeptidase MepM/ murein hydrolase activator NlpD